MFRHVDQQGGAVVNAFERGIVGVYLAIAATCLIALLVRWIVREVRKGPVNRRVTLPPPSDACRRNGPGAVP
jgi:hypothetical protein